MVEGVSGLASGIDSAAIVDALVQSDRKSVTLLENKKERLEAKREAVRSLNVRLLDVDLEGLALRRTSTFASRSVSPANEDILSARATTAVGTGDYTVSVDHVAQAHQIATQSTVSDKDAESYTGSIDLTVGGEATTISFDEASSLEDVARAINTSDADVRASLINVGNQSSPSYRMVLQSTLTGVDNAITDVVGSAGGGLDALFGGASLAGFDEVTSAQDAQVTVTIGSGANAISTTGTSANNEVEDLIAGFTVTAKEVGTTTVSVGIDNTKAENAVSDFVTALNDALQYHRDNATFDKGTREAGILFSENDIRSGIQSLKRSLLSESSDGSTIKTIGAIGVSFNEDTGLFDLDEGELSAALLSDPQGVTDLFIKGGMGNRINDALDRLTQSVDGVLAAKDNALSNNILDLSGRISDLDERLDLRRQRYEAEFLAMERIIGTLNTESDFLAGQIEGFKNLAASSSKR